MNTHGLMHSTKPPSPSSSRTKHVPHSNIKEKAKNKIIPQAFHQASAFMAKSKGHVSPPASERGNYPFPVREQQMIASYGGAFSGAEICHLEGEGALIFWQLYIYFYHVFFHWSFVARSPPPLLPQHPPIHTSTHRDAVFMPASF